MGFLRKRKNREPEELREAAAEETEETAAAAEEEEDDFTPPQNKKVQRDEFRAAADANASEVIESRGAQTDDAETPDNNADDAENDENDGVPQAAENGAETPETYAEARSEHAGKEQESEPEDDFEDDFGDDFYDGDELGAADTEAEEHAEDDGESETEEEPEKEKTPLRDRIKVNKKVVKGIGIGVGVVAAAFLCVYVYGCVTVPKDVIMNRVFIEGNDVSGLTREQATEKLQSAALLDDTKITLRCGGETFEINGADIGLAARIDETVDKAMNYGKTGNIFADGFVNMLRLFSDREIVPDAQADETVLREKLVEFGRQIYGERVEHSLELADGYVIATPGKTGFDTNTDTAYEQVKTALENEQFENIDVTLNEGPPEALTVDRVDGFTYCDPIDAYYDINGNDIMVIKEVPGRYIDRDEVAGYVSQVYEGGPIVNIPFYYSNAAVTADVLQAKLFNATIASYSTSYGSSNSNRRANIANAASKINGTVLAPGRVFSFNDTVGPRTVANGFYTAKEYVNGETVDGIGGGTCQVSSTLYNAVLYSDLSIVSRTNHMFPVGYCPNGQDATVADSGVDFKFMNSMDYPIKISAVTSGATITVSIIGTQRDVPRTVKIVNTSTPVGEDTSVHSVRYVYDPSGNLISQDDLGNSYYMAH